MSEFLLDSLRIQNFRTFKDLTVDRLGRVNLIVGKNNVGKTALLEALRIWANPEFWIDYSSLLEKSFPEQEDETTREAIDRRLNVFRQLIHGRPKKQEIHQITIQIGRDTERRSIWSKVFFKKDLLPDSAEDNGLKLPLIGVGRGQYVSQFGQLSHEADGSQRPYLSVSLVNSHSSRNPLADEFEPIEVQFVSSDGVSLEDAGALWDGVIRNNRKKQILKILKIVIPSLEDLNWIHEPSMKLRLSGPSIRLQADTSVGRIPLISTESSSQSVPLSSYGEGAMRSLGIGLALLNAQNGLLLVDEFENGLHHSVQSDVWRMIFETARDLDVQVFATTHSQDCLRAFQRVADDYEDEEGMLIQLRRRRGETEDVVAVTADEEELSSALKTGVDPR